jgi:Trk K+ transport system NAD-binding subunit
VITGERVESEMICPGSVDEGEDFEVQFVLGRDDALAQLLQLFVNLLPVVRKLRQPYLIVDFDPEVIRSLSAIGEPHIYGDVGDEAFLDELEADHAKMIISTIPDPVVSSDLLTFLKNKNFRGVSIVTVHTQEEAKMCYELGATYVIIPNALSGEKFADILKNNKIQKKAWLDKKPQKV